jgi:replication-associated recombination protein RarA
MIPFSMQQSAGGYLLGEVASALQKSIRRGLEDDALFWATELDISGFGEYAWKRLKIMASEDVGLADPLAAVAVQSLYQSWKEQRSKKDTKHEPERLFFVHAVLLLARARKSRMIDHALIAFYEADRASIRREVPDFALDKHTAAGRKLRRGHSHFWEEGARVENAAPLADPYRERAREIRADAATLFDELE